MPNKNPTTQQLVQISDIRENILVHKNGSLRAIIEVQAINFELRSEDEQNAIIMNFQNFLNTLDFPLQIVINSRRLNIEKYVQLIRTSAETLQNELLKVQANEYAQFISEISGLANIMSKKFYIVIPLYVFDKPSKANILDGIRSVFKFNSTPQRIPDEKFAGYRTQLLQRVELILDSLIGLGLKTRLLEDQELQTIFYNYYNPTVDTGPKPEDTTPTTNPTNG